MSRMVLLAFVAACGIPLVLAIQHFRREPPVDTKAALAAPAVAKPASDARDQDPAAVAAAQATTNAVAAALAGPAIPPDSGDGVPAFDIARIEPTGEAVIAGRATPGATVELLRNGELHDRAVADQSGQFVMVPPRFPSGTYDLTLRSKQPDGKQATSKQSVAVACPYEQLRIRFYIHQNFPGDDFGVSKIKVKQACLNKLQYFIVRRIGAFAVLEYHHSDTDAFAPIQYIIRSESVRFP